MPRSFGLIRPAAVTADASVKTSAAPPIARLARWTKCQSVEKPSTQEYWHIGETTIRLASVRSRMESGSNRCGIASILAQDASSADRSADWALERLIDRVG